MSIRLVPLAILLCATTGCASIVSDSRYPLAVTSTPAGANFSISNQAGQVVHSGVTPGQVTLDAGAGYFDGETYTVSYSLAGHDPRQQIIDSEIDNWYAWGNLGFGGLIGWLIVDPATGAMYKLPGTAHATLYPNQPPVASAPPPATTTTARQRQIEDLRDQQLTYQQYMQRVREIGSQP